jgi:hypothetical protein
VRAVRRAIDDRKETVEQRMMSLADLNAKVGSEEDEFDAFSSVLRVDESHRSDGEPIVVGGTPEGRWYEMGVEAVRDGATGKSGEVYRGRTFRFKLITQTKGPPA